MASSVTLDFQFEQMLANIQVRFCFTIDFFLVVYLFPKELLQTVRQKEFTVHPGVASRKDQWFKLQRLLLEHRDIPFYTFIEKVFCTHTDGEKL